MVEFVADFDHLIEIMQFVLASQINQDIFISGSFDNTIYRRILDELLKSNHLEQSKIIIPFVSRSGILSRPYINRIINSGGQIRINSKFTNSIIAIGKYAFVLSFSYRYSKDNGIKTVFENCMITNNGEAVVRIKDKFISMWEGSMALINEA